MHIKIGKNKTGSILDIFFIIIIVVGLAMFLLILTYVVPKITNNLRQSAINDSSAARTALDFSDNITTRFDSILLFAFVGLLMGVLITSFIIDVHPIFIPIYIFLLAFAVIVGVIMSKVYQIFSNNAVLADAAANFTYGQAIINNYVVVIIGIGVLSMIIIFGKAKLFGGNNSL